MLLNEPCRDTMKLTEVTASDKLEGFRATKEVTVFLIKLCCDNKENYLNCYFWYNNKNKM